MNHCANHSGFVIKHFCMLENNEKKPRETPPPSVFLLLSTSHLPQCLDGTIN